ncbi:amino acid ABC transporter permease [Bordetella genomosp. 10]|uniref:Glutamate/aspartate import permease protein GltK n=1 Tax=Bordetella genomosp. 10 TaxID=1416804 RepID=A0A261S2K2_9BORD|nr:ABC transporter permease subunit [Bordetella genomosp. 10]OZI31576.1 amino acid ABC transporter permease [Bordetella genomosp. 10]
MHFDFLSLATFQGLATGLAVTIRVTITAVIAGLFFGTLLALARLGRWRPLRLLAQGYVDLFRALPLTMVMLGFYLVVPQMLQSLFPGAQAWDMRMASALVGFSLFEAAYYGEIIRAGVLSVPRGQYAAAASLGMRPWKIVTKIVLPQAFRKMIPLLLTQLIVLFQDSSLVFVIALSDFFTTAETIGERDGRVAEMMVIAGLFYFVVCFGTSRIVHYLARRNTA